MRLHLRSWTALAMSLLLALALVTAASGCAPSEPETIVIKFAHGYAVTDPAEETVSYLCDKWTEASGGQIQFERYPGSQLYDSKECHVAIRDNSIQMTIGSVLKGLQDMDDGWLIFNCPFLFRDWDHISRYMETEYGEALLEATEAAGAHHLSWHCCHMTRMYNAERPLETVDDLDALKLRVPGGKEMMILGEQLGFSAVALSWGEIVTALETGMIDGLCTTPSVAGTEELDLKRNTPYFLDYVVGVYPGNFIINTDFWNGLPADLREKLEATMPDIEEYSLKTKSQQIVDGLADLKGAASVTYSTPTPEFVAAMEEAARPAWEPVAEMIGWEAIEAALAVAD